MSNLSSNLLIEVNKVTDSLSASKEAVRQWISSYTRMNNTVEQTRVQVAILAVITAMQHYTVANSFEIDETDENYIGFNGLSLADEFSFASSIEELPGLDGIYDVQTDAMRTIWNGFVQDNVA